MASLASLREGIAANLASLTDVQISAYPLSNPTPPTAFVELAGPIEYDETMGRGHDEWTFRVVVIVGFTSDVGAHKRLDGMLDSSGEISVKKLIENDRTLGGSAIELDVRSTTGPRIYAFAEAGGATRPPYLGAEWTIVVWAAGV